MGGHDRLTEAQSTITRGDLRMGENIESFLSQ